MGDANTVEEYKCNMIGDRLANISMVFKQQIDIEIDCMSEDEILISDSPECTQLSHEYTEDNSCDVEDALPETDM